MAEGGVGACPQVFVVDSQASYVPMPDGKKARWAKASHKFLLLLVGVVVLGLVVEAFFIYNLYKQIEKLSSPIASGRQGDAPTGLGKSEVSNQLPTVSPYPEEFQRPFAQLIGSSSPVGPNKVVQWIHKGGETITYKMGYNNGSLLVEREGHYYLYSKLTLKTADNCSLIQHRVMKVTKAYGHAIELMKSKRFRCSSQHRESERSRGGEDFWNSFLAGIFHLQAGDEVFVTLDDIRKMWAGSTYNLMGAFMISP